QIEDNFRQVSKQGGGGELGEMTAHIGRVVDQLQEEVMRARMLPISYVFNKIPRLVRDLSRNAGKQVNLVVEGEDTELDRSLIEFIGDPLIHLLRNAMDHGIESPQTRVAAGKQPTGTIRLAAAHEEGHIVITVEDDGQGIDPERVRQAALKRGIITPEEANQLSRDEAIDLIFRPNLSTAEKVTEISGRGVGMDVVRANIERLSGSVVVDSKIGQGTTFRITLPLTLAIVQAMLVSLGDSVYAIPLTGIIESLYLADVRVNTVKGSPTILWRNSVLPLIDLPPYFNISVSNHNGHNRAHNRKKAIVTVAWGKQRVGLVVEEILGKQDIVVKSLNPIMGELPSLSGAAILGDGRVALIIDIPGLINTALQARR
ncbi:MAG: chemotaxis protein CheA, partial [Chloroflexota bacterium]